jgi:sulfur carrier protein
MCDKYLATLYYSNVMEITVNGSTRVCEAPLAVADLLQRMALAGKKVAVERNGEIVPRGAHGSTLLADGDRLEIVAAVGGG